MIGTGTAEIATGGHGVVLITFGVVIAADGLAYGGFRRVVDIVWLLLFLALSVTIVVRTDSVWATAVGVVCAVSSGAGLVLFVRAAR